MMERRKFILSILSLLCLSSFRSNLYAKGNVNDISEALNLLHSSSMDDVKEVMLLIKKASVSNSKKVTLKKLYVINDMITIPKDLVIEGNGPETGFVIKMKRGVIKYGLNVVSSNNKLQNFGIYYSSEHQSEHNIGNPDFIALFLSERSQGCRIKNLHIQNITPGKFSFNHCLRITGNNHVINSCSFIDGSMCVSIRGVKISVVDCYVTNNFFQRTNGVWSQQSDVWDGIVMEGSHDCDIRNNIVHDCGQSGIYCGGNGSGSSRILISHNVVYNNWNRGIDLGVTGLPSKANYVKHITVTHNIVYNNREAQIWLNNVTDSVVSNNKVDINSNYLDLYKGFHGGMVGIALGDGGNTNNNQISSNNINVISNGVASITLYGSGNLIHDNEMKGHGIWFNKKTMVLKNNKLGNNKVNN